MSSVLYDAAGPRTRRRIWIGSLVAAVLLAALLVVVGLRLAERGQFDADKWLPLIWPGNEFFPLVWARLWDGLQLTLTAAAVSIALSLLIGTVLASVRLSLGRYARMPLVAVIELLRGLPVVVSIFYASRVLPDLGVRLDTFWYLVIGLVAYNSVIVSEIVRAGVVSLPRGQVEAGLAIGLTRGQTLRIIQLPQAFRVMLPAVISQLIVVLKDTALAAVVLTGFSELMNEAGFVRLNLDNPLQTFTVVALIFITINYSLGRLAQWTEKRLSRSSGGADEATAAHAAENAAEARTGA